METETITAAELDEKFDDGESILEYADMITLKRPGLEPQSPTIEFPTWMVKALDREARRLGIDRSAVIKTWIAQQLDSKPSLNESDYS